ncbi:MAG: shikimate kinase [Actinomycetes bacterium]
MTEPVLMPVVLIGPPGAGKSTVGRALAERLGVAFRDTDADVEAAAGKSVADVFVQDGEKRFRELERDAVRVALDEHAGVLALGGGAVLAETTRELLKRHVVVLLEVDLAGAAQRVGLGQGRPLVGLNPRAQLRALMQQRRPLYDEVATATVDTSGVPVDVVVDRVLAALGSPS